MRRKINVQLVSISLIAIVATMLVMLFVFYDLFQTQVQDDLRANAIVLKNTGIFHSGNENALHMDYRKLRVTWISATGTVLYDNDADVGTMDNHMSRPEVKHAFKDGDGNAVRKSATMDTNTFYYAIKLNDGSILRVAREASNIWSVCGKILPIVAATILIMMILCIILAHIMTKNIIKPIEQMAVDLDDFSVIPAYKELEPFAATIRAQHTDILKSARMRQDFTANVSHELKTPLTVLKGHLSGMLNGVVGYENHSKYLQRSLAVTEKMEVLIRELLYISRIEKNKTSIQFANIDFAELLRTVIAELTDFISEKKLSLHINIPDRVSCPLDRAEMERAIQNILINAIRYSPDGEQVIVTVTETNTIISCSIENTGVKIPETTICHLFEPFYRVDISRNSATGGTGLGLYIVRGILENHNAEYGIKNTENGVCFWLRLPKKQ